MSEDAITYHHAVSAFRQLGVPESGVKQLDLWFLHHNPHLLDWDKPRPLDNQASIQTLLEKGRILKRKQEEVQARIESLDEWQLLKEQGLLK